jgi:multiple sugar transport system permease protein
MTAGPATDLAAPPAPDFIHVLVPVEPGNRRSLSDRLMPYVFTAPGLLLLGLFVILPTLVVIPMALFRWNLLGGTAHYVGLANFFRVLSSVELHRALLNTLEYVLLTVPVSLGLGLLAALAIHFVSRGGLFWRAVYFLPVATTLVAMAVVWKWMFRPGMGIVDRTIGGWLGLTDWLDSLHLALPAIAVIENWYQIGFMTVVFLAGLAAVPPDLHEAARLDGAGPVSRFVHVTFPALGPATVFALVTATINALRIYDTIATVSKGGPAGRTESLSFELWQQGITYFDVGGGAVITAVLIVLTLAVTAVLIRGFGRRLEEAGSR